MIILKLAIKKALGKFEHVVILNILKQKRFGDRLILANAPRWLAAWTSMSSSMSQVVVALQIVRVTCRSIIGLMWRIVEASIQGRAVVRENLFC